MEIFPTSLPYYPNYKITKMNGLCIIWFDPNFSQNKYNFANEEINSKSCTLIAIIMTGLWHNSQIIIDRLNNCSIDERLIYLLGHSIIIANNLMEAKKIHKNINIKQAIHLIGQNLNGITEWVTLIDPHEHSSTKGAFIAISSIHNLENLCLWLCLVFSKYYNCLPILYELSFLHFPLKLQRNCCCNVQ